MIVQIKEGLTCEVDSDALDDMELVEALADIKEENPLAIAKVAELLLGKSEKKRLYDGLRNEKGRVKTSEVSEAIITIFAALGNAGKNS